MEAIDHDLAELGAERETAGFVSSVGEDGEPDFGSVPIRYVPALMERLHEMIEADRRTLEAQRAIIAGTAEQALTGSGAEPAKGDTLAGVMALWEAHRKPTPRTRIEATAVGRFERLAGRLPYGAITDEHARRFKADLLADDRVEERHPAEALGDAPRPCVAVDGGLLDANPFSRVKLRPGDNSRVRSADKVGARCAVRQSLGRGRVVAIPHRALHRGAARRDLPIHEIGPGHARLRAVPAHTRGRGDLGIG